LKTAIIKGDMNLTTQPTANHIQHSQYFFQETLEAYDPNNLHSFNANIQHNTVNSLTLAGSAGDLRINPEGYPGNII
jgi:hypothetical protein